MPNNENYYRIKIEFAHFLKGLSEFNIVHCESEGYINVTIQPAYFSRVNSRYTPQYLIEQIFHELEKDYIEGEELLDLGKAFKNYWLLLKQIDIDRTYYSITPGVMAAFFIILHIGLLILPANKALIYSNLVADFYGLGFWLFSVWSLGKKEQALYELEKKLMEKINFLKFLSPLSPTDQLYRGSFLSSSLSLLPSYEDVLLEDAMRCMEEARMPRMIISPNTSHFFYPSRFNNECCDRNVDEADPRTERCYSI